MGDKKPGADAQVFSDESPENWYPEDEKMAEPNGGEEKPEPSDKEEEEEIELGDEEEAGEEEDKEEDGEGELDKKEEKKDDRLTFNKALDQEEVQPIPEKRPRHPQLEDGDFTVNDDGGVTIHAKHLIDDYQAVIDDTKVFFKIFDSKNNNSKAEFIAEKLLGFESDGVRTPGRVAYDVLDAFNNAKSKADQEKIVKDFFPDVLKDSETEVNATFEEKSSNHDSREEEAEDEIVTEKDISTALKLWKVDSDSDVDITTAMDNPEFFEAYNGFQFNIETGEPLSTEERVALAADVTFVDEAPTPKKVGRDIQVGGDKKGTPSKKSVKETSEPMITTGDTDPNTWY